MKRPKGFTLIELLIVLAIIAMLLAILNPARSEYNKYKVSGQNVLHADGRSTYENTSNVGVNQDNIYTYWSKEKEPSQQDIQGGTAPTERNPENDAKSKDDSFLAI